MARESDHPHHTEIPCEYPQLVTKGVAAMPEILRKMDNPHRMLLSVLTLTRPIALCSCDTLEF